MQLIGNAFLPICRIETRTGLFWSEPNFRCKLHPIIHCVIVFKTPYGIQPVAQYLQYIDYGWRRHRDATMGSSRVCRSSPATIFFTGAVVTRTENRSTTPGGNQRRHFLELPGSFHAVGHIQFRCFSFVNAEPPNFVPGVDF